MAKQEFTENEITQALNQLVEEGKLHLIIGKDGVPRYVENTFTAGYNYATAKGDDDGSSSN